MTQVSIAALQAVFAVLQLPLQLAMVDAAFDGTHQEARAFLRFDKEIGGAQSQSGGHGVHITVISHNNNRHLNIEIAHRTTYRCPGNPVEVDIANHTIPGTFRPEDGFQIGHLVRHGEMERGRRKCRQ